MENNLELYEVIIAKGKDVFQVSFSPFAFSVDHAFKKKFSELDSSMTFFSTFNNMGKSHLE